MAADSKLLIFVPRLTNRVGYTLNVLFRHILLLDFEITDNTEYFVLRQCPKLCYGPSRLSDAVWIKNSDLLFATTISEQEQHFAQYEGYQVPFAVYGKDLDFPFDMLAATFYLVSRYEEYLPHINDVHGRFMAEESLAAQCHFLQQPIVEIWAQHLASDLVHRYPMLTLTKRHFEMETTIDIDAAYCYLHKGATRTVLGFLRDSLHRHNLEEVKHRWQVLTHKAKDPFDTFDFILHGLHVHPKSRLIFFALMADYALYDKPISYHNIDFLQLLQHLDDFAKMGLHASYASFDKPEKIDVEQARLAGTIHRDVQHNRCHFLRLALPTTYRNLIHAGIRHDYTMGYAEQVGFRAGISSPYPFYDISSNHETPLMIHPFATMDATMMRYLHQTPDESWHTIKTMMDSVAAVQGTFSCIFHNENLSESFGWQGWQNVYEQVLDYGDILIKESRK
jgi:hypothetical protein